MNINPLLTRRVLLVLCVLGIIVAGYLTFSAFTETGILCSPGSPYETVRQSPSSKVMGIPVALIGLVGYLGIFGAVLLEKQTAFFEDNGAMLIFGLSLIGFIYSIYLTYLENAVIHALCPYCVMSAVLMTLIFAISVYRTITTIQA
jgi:uncharacterized membrane protein